MRVIYNLDYTCEELLLAEEPIFVIFYRITVKNITSG